MAANSTSINFQSKNLDLKVRCMNCATSVAVKDWYCECKDRWHLCRKHSMPQIILPIEDYNPKGQPQPARKRLGLKRKRSLSLLDNGSYDSILADDIRNYRERKKRLNASQAPCLSPTSNRLKRKTNPNFPLAEPEKTVSWHLV